MLALSPAWPEIPGARVASGWVPSPRVTETGSTRILHSLTGEAPPALPLTCPFPRASPEAPLPLPSPVSRSPPHSLCRFCNPLPHRMVLPQHRSVGPSLRRPCPPPGPWFSMRHVTQRVNLSLHPNPHSRLNRSRSAIFRYTADQGACTSIHKLPLKSLGMENPQIFYQTPLCNEIRQWNINSKIALFANFSGNAKVWDHIL